MTPPVPPELLATLSAIDTTLQSVADALNNTTSPTGGASSAGGSTAADAYLMSGAKRLDAEITRIVNSMKGLPIENVFGAKFKSMGASAESLVKQINDARLQLASGVDVAGAQAKLDSLTVQYDSLQDELLKQQGTLQNFTATMERTRRVLNDTFADSIMRKYAESRGMDMDIVKTVVLRFQKVLSDAMAMAAEGIKQAASLSVTAQEGVALEFSNQMQSIKSIFTLDPNQIVRKQELYSAQQGIITALSGISDGLQIDPNAVANMMVDMRTGLRSQIIPTAETLKTFTTMGIKPTANAMNELREATGRAAIGQAQMDVLNKNRSALQIFGLQVAKTALDLERAGISLTSVMAGSESYVTNLDQGLDSIAQLNQLGTNIDFGQLTMLQEFDPAAALQYVADSISPEQLQSSSFRALLKQLPGLNMEELLNLKGMDANGRALESATTQAGEAGKKAGFFATALAWVTQSGGAVAASFLTLGVNLIGAIASLIQLRTVIGQLNTVIQQVAKSPAGGVPPTGPTPPSGAAQAARPSAKSAAGTGAAVGGAIGVVSGISTYNETGSVLKAAASAIGPILGGILGGMIGTGLAAVTGGAGAALIPMMSSLGAMLGGMASSSVVKGMDDGISAPEAGRTLTTSAGTFQLNPSDTVVAGTNLGVGKQQQAQTQQDLSPLMKKMDELITVIQSANTTIQVPGMSQTVNRMQLVGVYTRDESVRSI